MNCFLETIASIWMLSVKASPVQLEEEEAGVHDNLESCRNSLETRESDLAEGCRRLGREALRRRQAGDMAGAKVKMMERRRALKRLERLRSSLALVDAQLDALRTTELDKELMQTLLASSAALKKAGVGKGVKEAEAVMSELDEQLRESGELTSVLAGGLQDSMGDGDFDLDEEFEQFEKECELLSGLGTASISPAMISFSTRQEMPDEVEQPPVIQNSIGLVGQNSVGHNSTGHNSVGHNSTGQNSVEDTPSGQHLPVRNTSYVITT